mgnify:FL=1
MASTIKTPAELMAEAAARSQAVLETVIFSFNKRAGDALAAGKRVAYVPISIHGPL